MLRVFIDTEFMERQVVENMESIDDKTKEKLRSLGVTYVQLQRCGVWTIDLISFGMIVTDDMGREVSCYYAESAEFPPGLFDKHQWLRENVKPKLSGGSAVVPIESMREEILKQLGNPKSTGHEVRLYGWYGAHDMVLLEQIMGGMAKWPGGWSMHIIDLRVICELASFMPPDRPESEQHHALWDARWTADVWRSLNKHCLRHRLPVP